MNDFFYKKRVEKCETAGCRLLVTCDANISFFLLCFSPLPCENVWNGVCVCVWVCSFSFITFHKENSSIFFIVVVLFIRFSLHFSATSFNKVNNFKSLHAIYRHTVVYTATSLQFILMIRNDCCCLLFIILI